MADIKQAAKWMKEGKRVKRADWRAEFGTISTQGLIYWLNDDSKPKGYFSTTDLLADDWQLAD